VVQKVLRKARKGCQVVYVPGNHDEAARHYTGLDFGGIAIRREAEHITADGKRLLIIHGDEFDGVIQHIKWLAYVGDSLYTVILQLNRGFNWLRKQLDLPYWSLSQYLKHKVKNAVNFISDFEKILAGEARRRHYDGVICGHIHKAEIRDIDGVLYGNSGDWVESLSALVEHADGRLEVVYWTTLLSQPEKTSRKARASQDKPQAGIEHSPLGQPGMPVPQALQYHDTSLRSPTPARRPHAHPDRDRCLAAPGQRRSPHPDRNLPRTDCLRASG
jgi:UDP-2,3-diacylglucosamine pyrophosphatase LpxH